MKKISLFPLIVRLNLFVFFLFVSSYISAQRPGGNGSKKGEELKNGSITGKITDKESGKGLEFVNIALYKTGGMTGGKGAEKGNGEKKPNEGNKKPILQTGCITAKNGTFKLTSLPMGNYKLKISFIGYKNKTIEKNLQLLPQKNAISVGVVSIEPDINQIGEVNISETKQAVVLGIDKKEFNVSKDMTAQGGNAADVLQKIPSVDVDMDGNVSLRGNEQVTILIDGKPSAIASGDVAAFFEQLPASSIQSIEVITNPSVKFSPEGMAGIINIVLKKNKLRGTNGSVTASVGSGDKQSGSVNISHFSGNLNLFADANIRNDKSFRSGLNINEMLNNGNITSITKEESDGYRGRDSKMLKAGAEYYINDFNSISLTGIYDMGGYSYDVDFFARNYTATNDLIDEETLKNISEGDKAGFGGTFDYKKTFLKPGQEFTTTINYSKSDNNGDANYNNARKTYSKGISDNTNVQIDYTHPLDNGMKIESGYEGIFRTSDDDFKEMLYLTETADFIENESLSNRFLYAENINGLYAMLSGKLSKINYQLGLRSEYVYNVSDLKSTSSKIDTSYFELYPSAHLSYAIKDHSTFQLSYSKRVNRPRSRNLNPFERFSSSTSIRKGNPYLRPEFINSYELSYLYRNKIVTVTSALYYKSLRDNIGRISDTLSRRSSENKIDTLIMSSYANYGKGSNYGVELAANVNIAKWWQMNASFNAYYQKIDGSNISAELTTEGTAWSVKAMSDFTLWKGANAQLSYFYRAPKDIPTGKIQAFTMFSAAVKQKFLDNNASLMLSVKDPFGMMHFELEKHTNSYNMYMERNMEKMVFMLTFNYRFGKLRDSDMQKRKKGDKNGGDDMEDMY